MTERTKTVAVVIPVFNEEANIEPLCSRLAGVIGGLSEYKWRIIFVDDGSVDRTVELLELRREELPITILQLSRNFGHQAALKAGLDHADADAVITMDGDLQHGPELIVRMLEKWRAGSKIVHAVRGPLAGGGIKSLAGSAGYRIINFFADRPLLAGAADFRLVDRLVADVLKQMYSPDPMLRGLVAWLGFEPAAVSYQVQPRGHGKSRYPLRQMCNLLVSGIFDFSARPLLFGLLAALILIFLAIVGHPYCLGWFSSLVWLVLIVAAVELLALALIGVYLGRAYRQSQGWPMYVIAEKLNIE